MRREFERENFREGELVFHCTGTALPWSWGPAGPILGRFGGATSAPFVGVHFDPNAIKGRDSFL